MMLGSSSYPRNDPGKLETALIGYSGFVGSNLSRQTSFGQQYNSTNFREMVGRHFDVLVCAGVSAAKWIANREPEEDRRRIGELAAVLDTMSVGEFVLISTIDVYPDPAKGGDETTAIDPKLNHHYGRHRRELEQWSDSIFPNCRIVRLPALFGWGLKKNALFDLMHDNQMEQINPEASFQWYPIRRLWSDIETARRAGLHLVNFVTEPLSLSRIIQTCFPNAAVGSATQPAPAYRLTTRNAALYNGANGYILSADDCLTEITSFVSQDGAVRWKK